MSSDTSNGFSTHRGPGEPNTPGKGSEVPLNSDRPLKPGERAEQSGNPQPEREKPEAPGGAGDIKRI